MKKTLLIIAVGLTATMLSVMGSNADPRNTYKAEAEATRSHLPTLLANEEDEQVPNPPNPSAKIQVVFTLDCTGSMGGLIQAAKDKIWSIATGMSQTEPKPDISFGFVFYRDRGDAFVTKKIPLTNDMDLVYKELMTMQAAGGGDMPESVNQALYESVKDFQWDPDTMVYKVIFLVGDAPPHMDYQDDVKYPQTCKMAVKKDIVINTIQCGSIHETEPIWKEIAQRGYGAYLRLSQSGSEVVIKTPYDDGISHCMRTIDETRIYYGSTAFKSEMKSKTMNSEKINSGASSAVLAKRAEYISSNSKAKEAYMGRNELVSDLESGKVKLEAIKVEDLPDNMQKMTLEERKKYVREMAEKRRQMEAQLALKIKEREKYVAEETEKLGEDAVKNSFSGNVHQVIVEQAKVKNITIDKKVKH